MIDRACYSSIKYCYNIDPFVHLHTYDSLYLFDTSEHLSQIKPKVLNLDYTMNHFLKD